MKKITFLLYVFILVACTPKNSFKPQVPLNNSPTPPTPELSPEASPTSITPEAASIETAFFRDDFDGKLAPEWQWTNENQNAWNLNAIPGSLQLQAEYGYIQLGNAKNLLLTDVPTSDFSVETGIKFYAWDPDIFAGMVLYESDSNFVIAGIGNCVEAIGCINEGFYIFRYEDNKLTQPIYMSPLPSNHLLIRMEVKDGSLGVFANPTGTAWFRIYSEPLSWSPKKAGLFAGQNSNDKIVAAEFTYFSILNPSAQP